ncbi:MAG: putative zinc-binding metallopeptidase, partial [Candidatus Omnitrophica bacterium]|nr:putative zinc-binding metallopeptidase [Candidatus Omnitrophota bacterium]
MMLEAEGGTKEWCMKLLRHEMGHALCYAYRLNKLRKWQKIFGLSSEEYADTCRYRPYSKNYVRHLRGFYAQYHPDEDFVETFAVWLTPDSQWQEKYQGWKALDKLKFVDGLMGEIRGKDPLIKTGKKLWHFKKMTITLENFYKKRRRFHVEEFPDFYDAALKKIFPLTVSDPVPNKVAAREIFRKYQKRLVEDISRWTGERKYVINDLFKTMSKRGQQLKLFAAEEESVLVLRVSSYLTTLVMNYLYTGWYRGERKRL